MKISKMKKKEETLFKSKTTIYLKDQRFHKNTTWEDLDAKNTKNWELSKEDTSKLIFTFLMYFLFTFLMYFLEKYSRKKKEIISSCRNK